MPIKCENCHKTLAYKSTNLRIEEGEIIIKCRNCKQMHTVKKKIE